MGGHGSGSVHPKREEGVRLLREGLGAAEVARRLGVHPFVVYQWANQTKTPAGKPRYRTHPRRAEALDMIAEGLSCYEVAKIIGVHTYTVYRWRQQKAGQIRLRDLPSLLGREG